jgi:tetratricopeptide (TPR) repeat protein
MKVLFRVALVVGALGAGWSVAMAAEERPLEFLHALQAKDYDDVAVEYLKKLKAEANPPAEVIEVWDLEMSKSLRGAANRAYSPQDFEQLLTEAQNHLEKFVREKPSHPEAVSAMVSGGMFAMDRALQRLKAARSLADKDGSQKTKLWGEARTALQQAKPRFLQAANRYYELRIALPPAAPAGKRPPGKQDRTARLGVGERERLEGAQANAEFQAALSDYWLAQTYDPVAEAAARKDALAAAEKAFDGIWQRWRVDRQSQISIVGLTAHMWTGKCADERGDHETAREIYSEVLAAEPDAKVADKLLDPLFAEVERFYLAIVARENPTQFLAEAIEWLDLYRKKSERYPAYQAITLEVVKSLLAMAERASGEEKRRLSSQAMLLLAGMAKIPSPSQQEGFQLRRKLAGSAAASGDEQVDPATAKTFDEAIALGDQAYAVGRWPSALAGYRKALDLAPKGPKDAERVGKVREAIVKCQLRTGDDLVRAGKPQESLDLCRLVLREEPRSPLASEAGGLAIRAALAIYASVPATEADNREKAMAQLEQVCQFAEKTWPGDPVADDARLARGKAAMLRRHFDDAAKIFELVNAKSARYPISLYLTALAGWQRYLIGKRDRDADKAGLDEARARTKDRAMAAVLEFRKRAEPGKPMAADHIDAQRLLAEVAMDASQLKEAIDHIAPLVEAVKSNRAGVDNSGLAVLLLATRAYLAAGDAAKAAEVGMILADTGADLLPINIVLVQFAQQLDQQRQAADAELIKATAAGDAKAAEAAKAKLEIARKRMGTVLAKLAARRQHSLAGMMIIADLSESSKLLGEAKQLYDRILATPQLDRKAENRARAKLAGLLRQEGKFQEAYQQAQKLSQDNPNALEPQMELARVLQGWAATDPKNYDEAVARWTKVRNALERLAKKPDEYYEVIYNAAYCLHGQASAQTDQAKSVEKAKEAKQWLNSALIRKPELNGPDMVARYKTLLEKLDKMAP